MTHRIRACAFSVALCLLAGVAAGGEDPHLLLHNFSRPIPGGDGLRTSLERETVRVGLAAARIAYKGSAGAERQAYLPDEAVALSVPGEVRFWLQGDGSGNVFRLVFRQANAYTDGHGNRRLRDHRDTGFDVPLDFTGWKEFRFDLAAHEHFRDWSREKVLFWRRYGVVLRGGEDAVTEGTILLDDLRLVPPRNRRPAFDLHARLFGASTRTGSGEVAISLDARNFQPERVTLQARVVMTDRNENPVVERDFEIPVEPKSSKEALLRLEPGQLESYLPPFRLTGDILSPDHPDISGRIDETLVLANSRYLFESFADPLADWWCRPLGGRRHGLSEYTLGEYYRIDVRLQTAVRIAREAIPEAERDPAGEAGPPTRHALRVDYTGHGAVFNGRGKPGRYLPGNAFRAGVWVKGDGSGSRFYVTLHDYSNMADFWPGGWKKERVERTLCRLDFTGWRYFTFPLPGNGQGKNSRRGSTHGIDFPIEIGAFGIEPPRPRKGEEEEAPFAGGSIRIGPIYTDTQQALVETLSLAIGYDDAARRYAADRGAWVAIQNASPWNARTVQSAWSLLDRNGNVLAKGAGTLKLKPGMADAYRIEPDALAAGRDAPGPLRLEVNASDLEKPSIAATEAVMLAKPDSRYLLADFEEDRGFLGLKANGAPNPPGVGRPAARPTDAQAHGGARSLPLAWERRRPDDEEQTLPPVVSVDPPMPGVPTRVSLWIHGDGSGVLFYPVIGDRSGVNSGLPNGNWDILFARAATGDLQQAVRVDWTGWKEVTFDLPPVPATWDQDLPVLEFVPSYPFGLHLATLADGKTKGDVGRILVDDIAVETHLPAEERVRFRLAYGGESNVVGTKDPVRITVASAETGGPRTVRLVASVTDWRGAALARLDRELTLPAAGQERIALVEALPPGAYLVNVELFAGEQALQREVADVIVADLAPVLGEDWSTRLQDPWELRKPIGEVRELVDEDWDWLEYFAGNHQWESSRRRIEKTRNKGLSPIFLLGYSTYWASGPGFEARQVGQFQRRRRHIGQGVDVFRPPMLLEDWENYILETVRMLGNDIDGWMLWRSPDSTGPIGVEPELFLKMMGIVYKWRQVYCPDVPLVLGDMNHETAVPYLAKLIEGGAAEQFDGVNVRMDVGRQSPEDAQVGRFAQNLTTALKGSEAHPKRVTLTDLDWAVEASADGLDAYDQAAYLARAAFLLRWQGIRSTVAMINDDVKRLGVGLAYRRVRRAPPLSEQPKTLLLKPGWIALANARGWLERLSPTAAVPVQDRWPDRSLCLLYADADGQPVAVVWRNNDAGHLSFAQTGLAVQEATDLLGAPVADEDGWYAVGKLPVAFRLAKTERPAVALRRIRVRDGAAPAWYQRTLVSFVPGADAGHDYVAEQATPAVLSGRTPGGESHQYQGLRFAGGGVERFSVAVPKGSGLALRKGYLLAETGQTATVMLNGAEHGVWDLQRSEPELSGGLREAVYFIPAEALGGKETVQVEVRYEAPANTTHWVAHAWDGGAVPLTAVGPVHADQNVAQPRWSRNIVGSPLRVGTETFTDGIGSFAQSLLEYPLNGQFQRFTAKVGVDAATEGKGSVRFEIHADGKKVWTSALLSGLDTPVEVDLPVEGVNRLRLILSDGGDGNKFDAGDWLEPVLHP